MLKFLVKLVFIGMICSISVSAWSGEAKKSGVKIYAHKKKALNEKPIAELSAGDVVTVQKSAGSFYKVKTVDGGIGYVAKSDIKRVKDIGKQINMSGEDILGDLGDIEAVYIFEDDDKKLKGLKLERSFKDEMKAPVDKEKLERKDDEYVKW